MRSPLRVFLFVIASALAYGCSSPPTCADACENLETCGKLRDSRLACENACENDPSVIRADVRCFAESTCEEIDSCFHGTNPVICYEMCHHIYETCRSRLQLRNRTLDFDGCQRYCRTEVTETQANCVRHFGCGRLSEIGECFSG